MFERPPDMDDIDRFLPGIGKLHVIRTRHSKAGQHLVLQGPGQRHRLLVRHSAGEAGFFLPADSSAGLRMDAIRLFRQATAGAKIGRVPSALTPTAYQRHRLVLLLRILDCLQSLPDGVSPTRQVASSIVFPGADRLKAIEWKTSSQRRQTQRLIAEAQHFAHEGFRSLLACRMSGKVSDSSNS